ncbi:MAG: YciI family protein [bacterium]
MLSEPRQLQLLTYEYPDDMLERRGPHREAHLAKVAEWEAEGKLLMAGATGDPPTGAVLVFDCTPEEVEDYACTDPYSVAGLVVAHRIETLTAVAFPD